MRKLVAGFATAMGIAALWRYLTRKPAAPAPADAGPADAEQPAGPDPADELRRKLAEARETVDDRDEFDASEGTPVDQVEEHHSLEERRRSVHEQAQEALGRMHQHDGDE